MSRGERITQSEAARRLGITAQSLGVWATRPGAPVELVKGKRHCLWPDFPRWRDAELTRQARAEAAAAARPADFEDARARKMMADAALAEDELRVRRGQLVEVERFEKVLGQAYGRVRSRLLSLPSRAAPDLMGLTDELRIEAILDRYVLEVMEELRTDAVPDDETDEPRAAA